MPEEGGNVRSAYAMADMPDGASVPYLPMARSRERMAPPLQVMGNDIRMKSQLGPVGGNDHAAKDKPKIMLPSATRASQSVTEIPGAAALPMRLSAVGSFDSRIASKGIRTGAMGRQSGSAYEIDKPESTLPEPSQMTTFPVIMWFLLGLVFPPFLLCGCRYISSANQTAKLFAALSIFMFLVYITTGLIIFASVWKSDAWGGEDPSCVRYTSGGGEANHIATPLGDPKAIEAYDPGVRTVQNVSIYTESCLWMGQLVVDETSEDKEAPKVLYMRVITPGTQGDDFGVFARKIDDKINPAAAGAQSPARAWLEFADPAQSNPWAPGTTEYDQNQDTKLPYIPPQCLIGMCKGSYGQAAPLMGGAQYTLRVNLNWFKYYMVIGVVAKTQQALERPFCVETCVLNYIKQSDGSYREPCEGRDIANCDEVKCVFAATRKDCLGDPSLILL
eukprot:CAMPEP_0173105700 /NCGR_PEP_ID=MMETSP1102-20130122/40342_1 /TAXON_ID=49646 /ORGANISM="Geminigera sp., Strain Caron Lab Isolate" /LENGTH=446 /DNA_ID=CAMNT_0014002157 /DNA_START=110 /DNA_END=1450 /DNA_ORIENTATION=-